MHFRRAQRLSGRDDFKRLFAEGTRFRSGWLGLSVLPNGLSRTRFGCTVRRSVTHGGVLRNKLRRWVREAFRRHPEVLPTGLDVLAVILDRPHKLSYDEVEQLFLTLCQRAASAQKSSPRRSGSTKRSKPPE